MAFNIFGSNAKIKPQELSPRDGLVGGRGGGREGSDQDGKPALSMSVVRLHTILNRYGGQKHPRIESYEALKRRGELMNWRYVPAGSTLIYISHEWPSTNHADPDGIQTYHLLLVLDRLRKGKIPRTDMDTMHSLIYKHHYSVKAEQWVELLNSENVFIWYDWFCVRYFFSYHFQSTYTLTEK